MDFSKTYRFNIIVRALLLLFFGGLCLWGLINTEWQVTPLVSAAIVVLLLLEMIFYSEKVVRQFTHFLSSIKYRDYSTTISNRDMGRDFEKLSSSYRLITSEFQKLNSEKEINHQLLESVITHISVALLCINEDHDITLMNQSAKDLFRIPYAGRTLTLKKIDRHFLSLIEKARNGEKLLVEVQIDDEPLQLVMYTTVFRLEDEKYTLISFQNIRDELEQRETDSWQKLIRVLTHEIMNSVTPIVSLSSMLSNTILTEDGKEIATQLSESEVQDLRRSLQAIESRSEGLIQFVSTYSNLANNPTPDIRRFQLKPVMEKIMALIQPRIQSQAIDLKAVCPTEHQTVEADPQQIEQVLINLLNNACEALSNQDRKEIVIDCSNTLEDRFELRVRDNGPGIPQENLSNVFVPFYTTKKKGSGIGLSLSRQLMLANGGMLTVRSTEGQGAEFIMTLRK